MTDDLKPGDALLLVDGQQALTDLRNAGAEVGRRLAVVRRRADH